MNLKEAKNCHMMISSLRTTPINVDKDFFSMINTTEVLEFSPIYGKQSIKPLEDINNNEGLLERELMNEEICKTNSDTKEGSVKKVESVRTTLIEVTKDNSEFSWIKKIICEMVRTMLDKGKVYKY